MGSEIQLILACRLGFKRPKGLLNTCSMRVITPFLRDPIIILWPGDFIPGDPEYGKIDLLNVKYFRLFFFPNPSWPLVS